MEIKIGDTVKIYLANGRTTNDSAEVMEIRDDLPLGVRLSRPLAGFVWWDVDSLVVVDETGEEDE